MKTFKTKQEFENWWNSLTPAEQRKLEAANRAANASPERELSLTLSVLKIMAQMHRETASELSQLQKATAAAAAALKEQQRSGAVKTASSRRATIEARREVILGIIANYPHYTQLEITKAVCDVKTSRGHRIDCTQRTVAADIAALRKEGRLIL
jgi:hypothetical protein